MFQGDSSEGDMLLSDEVPKARKMQTPMSKTTKKCRWLFFLVVFLFACVVIAFMQLTEHVGLHQTLAQPGFFQVTFDTFNPLKPYLNSTFQKVVSSVNISSLQLPKLAPEMNRLFQHALSDGDMDMLSDNLEEFHKIMTAIPLTYFLYKGSLLGSYRHHSLIPWDDDLDLLVHVNDKKTLQREFVKRAPSKLSLNTKSSRFKVFNKNGHQIRKSKLKWLSPFLDISFYQENSTHLWDITLPHQKPFLKSDIFPLQDRPFLGHMYPAPRDPLKTLQMTYNIDDCYTGAYNHTSEKNKAKADTGTVPCAALVDRVQFVQHVRGPGGAWCTEMLTFRGHVLGTFIRDANNIPVC